MQTPVYIRVQSDMLNEATLMAKLNHRHIVCMVGICQAENIMLVLELAALGPLNKYLKKNRLVIVPFIHAHRVAQI